jgi:hypothetical protein
MTAEKERWAEALAIEQRYRDNAGKQITGRMYAMARAGNVAGVARWMPIAQKLDDLREDRLFGRIHWYPSQHLF